MIRWKGPVAALAVFFALSRLGPTPDDCVVRERTIPPPPPPTDPSAAWSISVDSLSVGPAAADPFALANAPKVSGGRSPAPARVAGPTPSRPWRVTGLVGRRAAVLVKSDGSSVVVSIGQELDSARVVGISSAGVELEDRGGRFLLKVR